MIKSPNRTPLKVDHTIAQQCLKDLFEGRETAREVRIRLRELESYITVAFRCGARVEAGEYDVRLPAASASSRTAKRARLSVFKAKARKGPAAKSPSKIIVFQPRGAA